jgi:hypothetical protein
MRTITMTEKRKLTEAMILASTESISITNRGETIGVIIPDWRMVAEFRESQSKKLRRQKPIRKRPPSKGNR